MQSVSGNQALFTLGRTIIDERMRPGVGLLGYAAGLFEGEGCIAISSLKGRSGKPAYLLVATIRMGDREPLDVCREWWLGQVYEHPMEDPRRRLMFSWRLSARQAAAFLRDIAPLLVSERLKTKATLAIAFQDQKRHVGRKPPPEYLERQAAFYAAMRKLNRQGSASLGVEERYAVLGELLPLANDPVGRSKAAA